MLFLMLFEWKKKKNILVRIGLISLTWHEKYIASRKKCISSFILIQSLSISSFSIVCSIQFGSFIYLKLNAIMIKTFNTIWTRNWEYLMKELDFSFHIKKINNFAKRKNVSWKGSIASLALFRRNIRIKSKIICHFLFRCFIFIYYFTNCFEIWYKAVIIMINKDICRLNISMNKWIRLKIMNIVVFIKILLISFLLCKM